MFETFPLWGSRYDGSLRVSFPAGEPELFIQSFKIYSRVKTVMKGLGLDMSGTSAGLLSLTNRQLDSIIDKAGQVLPLLARGSPQSVLGFRMEASVQARVFAAGSAEHAEVTEAFRVDPFWPCRLTPASTPPQVRAVLRLLSFCGGSAPGCSRALELFADSLSVGGLNSILHSFNLNVNIRCRGEAVERIVERATLLSQYCLNAMLHRRHRVEAVSSRMIACVYLANSVGYGDYV